MNSPATPALAFDGEARRLVSCLPAGDLTRRVLAVMLTHGLGRRSALSLDEILAHLTDDHGAVADAAGIGRTLAALEDGPVALARTAGEPARYFLITKRGDAVCARAERVELVRGYRDELDRLERWLGKQA